MSFVHPLWLLAGLIGLGLLIWLYRWAERRKSVQALAYSNVAFALAALRPSRWPAMLLFAAFVIGASAELVAVARPRVTTYVPTKDGTVMICIDTSGSMRARDLSPNRWAASKQAAAAFIDSVPEGTHVGLITFSAGANLIAQPVGDLDSIRDALNRIPPPDGGTAIGDALTLAAQQMPEKGRRIIVLLTDGVNNRGSDPLSASEDIGKRGIVIETVGIGTSGSGEIIPGTNELADIDTDALKTIAANARGQFVFAGDSGTLRDAFKAIALDTVWEKKRIDASFPVALGGGLVLVITLIAGLATGRFP